LVRLEPEKDRTKFAVLLREEADRLAQNLIGVEIASVEASTLRIEVKRDRCTSKFRRGRTTIRWHEL
jgi:hypothetical protein